MFAYTEWANGQMVESIRGLSDEQFTQNIPSSFPTIRETLAHIVLAEWLWLRRWKGESPSARPEWAAGASLATIEGHLRAVQSERAEWLASLTDDDLERVIDYRNLAGDPFSYRLFDLMAHLVNHSTYHRGQLTTMLRQVGVKPPATDFVNLLPTLK